MLILINNINIIILIFIVLIPWLNKSIVKSMKKRNQMFKKAKKTGDFSHYRLARNRTLAQLRLAKKNISIH